MILQASILFVLISAVGLTFGLLRRSIPALFALNLLWWLGAFVSAYFAFLAWVDRGHSENWAVIGFMYLTLPFAVPAVVLSLIELYFLRKWSGGQVRLLRSGVVALLAFLLLQIFAGFISV